MKVVWHGKKLKGEFAIVKMKGGREKNAWLLIKHKDKYAVDGEYNSEDYTPKRVIAKKKGDAEKEVVAAKKAAAGKSASKKGGVKKITAKETTAKKAVAKRATTQVKKKPRRQKAK
jgi:bifunctional non-homologous end joining protein LigD